MEKDTQDNSLKVSKELLKNQHERLSNKHIKTLNFLQAVAKENHALKERIKILEEENLEVKSTCQCINQHDFVDDTIDNDELQKLKDAYAFKVNEIAALASKHNNEVMKLQEEKYELERELKEQILKMHHEIEALKAANTDLRETVAVDENNESNKNMQDILSQKTLLEEQNEELKNDIESLREDLHIFQSKNTSSVSQVHDLKEENKHLKDRLQEAQQKANELELRLDKALKQLSDTSKSEADELMIQNLYEQIQNLQQEYQKRLQFESQMKEDFLDLNSFKDEVMKANLHLQNEVENLLNEYGQLALECNKLKKHSQDIQDKNSFKDFVLLKRQLNILKDENDYLKLKARPELSVLKEETLPHPPLIPKKKKSLDGARNSVKKLMAITVDDNGS